VDRDIEAAQQKLLPKKKFAFRRRAAARQQLAKKDEEKVAATDLSGWPHEQQASLHSHARDATGLLAGTSVETISNM
jgi:hypothetical protein